MMVELLIIQECVVLLVAALLGILWWGTRSVGKTLAAENERRAEVLRRVTLAYGAVKTEVEQWRQLKLMVEHCPVSLPTPADYAAANGSGKPARRRQCGPWTRAVDEPLTRVQHLIRAPRPTGPLTQRTGPFRIDLSAEWLKRDRKPYGFRADVSTRFYTDGLGGTPGLGGSEILVTLCGVPAYAKLPDFDDELGELETAGGWYHVPAHASGNKAAAAVAAVQLEMEGNGDDH